MFVLNGIVYASEKRNDIEVISVKPLDDMMMILTFSTGEQRLFDATILDLLSFRLNTITFLKIARLLMVPLHGWMRKLTAHQNLCTKTVLLIPVLKLLKTKDRKDF